MMQKYAVTFRILSNIMLETLMIGHKRLNELMTLPMFQNIHCQNFLW